MIVDGEMEILPGVHHPSGIPRPYGGLAAARSADQHRQAGVRLGCVFVLRGHPRLDGGKLQQTDFVQQFLAYEKCYKITGGYENCVAAHEPLSYTDKYPSPRIPGWP